LIAAGWCGAERSFINKLTRALPFRDHNTVTFSEPVEIII
jgi:hypothetical protein